MKIFKLGASIKRKEVGRVPQYEEYNFQGNRFGEDCFADQGNYGPVVGNPALPETYFT